MASSSKNGKRVHCPFGSEHEATIREDGLFMRVQSGLVGKEILIPKPAYELITKIFTNKKRDREVFSEYFKKVSMSNDRQEQLEYFGMMTLAHLFPKEFGARIGEIRAVAPAEEHGWVAACAKDAREEIDRRALDNTVAEEIFRRHGISNELEDGIGGGYLNDTKIADSFKAAQRTIAADRVKKFGKELVDFADQLIVEIEFFLEEIDDGRFHNSPPETVDQIPIEELRSLLEQLRKFRDVLSEASNDPKGCADKVIAGAEKLGKVLKPVVDHAIVQVPALATASVGVSALSGAVGVPVDPNLCLVTMAAGSEGVKALGKAVLDKIKS